MCEPFSFQEFCEKINQKLENTDDAFNLYKKYIHLVEEELKLVKKDYDEINDSAINYILKKKEVVPLV